MNLLLLPVWTCCSLQGPTAEGGRDSTRLPPPPPFSGPYRAPSCSAPKIELIVPRAGKKFTGGCNCVIARGGSTAGQGAWPRAQRSCLRPGWGQPGCCSAWIPPGRAARAQPDSGTRVSAGGRAWDMVLSRAGSLSAEPGGPHVLPGEQEAQCQRHSSRAVPPSHRPPTLGTCLAGELWCCQGSWLVSGEPQGNAGRCEAMAAKAADLKWQRGRAGRREAAAAGGKGGEPRALAVPPLTHQWKEKSVPRLTAATSKPPQLPWHSMAQQPLRVVRCTLQTPLPQQPPTTAQHGAGGRRGLPVGRSHGRALLALTQGLSPSPCECSARLAGSQETRHAAAPISWEPKGHLCPGAPRTAGAVPRRAAPASRHCPYSWEQPDQGSVGPSPPPAQPTKWAFRAGRRRRPRADLGRPCGRWDAAFPRRAGHSQRGACCPPDAPDTLLLARSHAGLPLSRHAEGSGCHGVAKGSWMCPGWSFPSSLPILPCAAPCASRHVPLPAHSAACGNWGQPSVLALRSAAKEPSQRREVPGAMPGALEEPGFVFIAANTRQGKWSPGFPTQTLHNLHLPSLQLPSSPRPPAAAQAAKSGPGAGPASSQRHHLHLAGACCAGRLGRETSGPAEHFPGRMARVPCAVASAPGPCTAVSQRLFLLPHPHPGNYLFAEEQPSPGSLL